MSLMSGTGNAVRRKIRRPGLTTVPTNTGSTRLPVLPCPLTRTSATASRVLRPGRRERALRGGRVDAFGAGTRVVSGGKSISARCLAAFVYLAFAAPAGGQEFSWKQERYDPAAARSESAADLYLPMPCGGAMAFQRVDVPADGTGPLAYERQARSGSPESGSDILDHLDSRHLRGGFIDTRDPAASYFFIARYEITAEQAAALRGDCPPRDPSPNGVLPALGLSWLDAYELGRRHTEWLKENAPDELPSQGDAPGFLRMPTEAEWVYAARGGLTQGPAAFTAPAYPMEGGIDAHAWHQGVSRGRAQRIGIRGSNPIGLHDVYGNAEELVLESFRIIDEERDPVQADMLVTRGGHYLSWPEDLNSEIRELWPFLRTTDGQPSAEDTFGMRPVLSTRLALHEAQVEELADQWLAAVSPDSEAEDGADLARLQALLRAERETVATLRHELEAARAELAEAEADRELRESSGNTGGLVVAIMLALSIMAAVLLMRPRRPVEIMLRRPSAESPRIEFLEPDFPSRPGEDRARLIEGEIVDGEVRSLGGSCAFVDLGGIDGVMHVSEMGDDKIEKPSDLLSAGDAVKVRIIEIDPAIPHMSLCLEEIAPMDSRPGAVAKKGRSRDAGTRADKPADSGERDRSGKKNDGAPV